MDFRTKTIKYKALQNAIYCPPHKDDNAIETVEIESFDNNQIKDLIRKSVALLSYERRYRPLILDVLDVLDENKEEFFLHHMRYITFYWNGILILRINISSVEECIENNKQLHVSLQKYQKGIEEKKLDRYIMAGVGGSITLAALFGFMTIWNNRGN